MKVIKRDGRAVDYDREKSELLLIKQIKKLDQEKEQQKKK